MNKPAFAALAEYMDLLLDAICVVDPEHRFSYLSPGAQRVFGYDPEEMIGRSMFDFMHPDHHAETLLRAEQVNSGRDVLHFENRYIHKDGSVIHLHWTARWSEKDQMPNLKVIPNMRKTLLHLSPANSWNFFHIFRFSNKK